MKKLISLYGEYKTKTEVRNYIQSAQTEWLSPKTRYYYLLKQISSGRVLDQGCGWGTFSKLIVDQTEAKVLGLDVDKPSIAIAKEFAKQSDRLKFSSASIQTLPDSSFDIVVNSGVIQNTLNPGNHLSECNRVLKKGGKLLITVYNNLIPPRVISQALLNQKKINQIFNSPIDITRDPVVTWSFYDFCRLAHSLGFKYIDHEFAEGVPLVKGYLHFSPLKKFYYVMVFVLEKEKYVNTFDKV